MRTCNHTEYLFRFWGKYLLDQSSLKKTRTHHQQNSGNVKEHEKFSLELFPTCCTNKGRVCWSSPPTLFIFWKRSMLNWRNEAWLRQSSQLFCPEFWCIRIFFFLSLLYPPAFSSFLPLLIPSTKDFQQRAAGAPYWLLSPDSGGLSQEINGCLFSPALQFYVWTDMAPTIPIHSAELFPFRCASLQIAEISGGPVSNCLSHLVFNLLKSGLQCPIQKSGLLLSCTIHFRSFIRQ